MPAFSDDAQNAVNAIAKSCRALQTSLDKTGYLNLASLLLEFQSQTGSSLSAIENYGTDVHFAEAIKWFVAAANSWNKHVYACLRTGNGEIQHVGRNVKLVLYAGEFTQELDEFQDTMSASESSPLRSLQSMQSMLEYYQTLVMELQSSLSFLSRTVEFQIRKQIYVKRIEGLQYRIRQLEFGFETAGAAWGDQRSLSNVALQWRQEEARIALEREQQRKRMETIQEQLRIKAKQAEEEAAMLAREEEYKQELELERVRAWEKEWEASLREAKRENAALRMKLRRESRQVGALIELDAWNSSSDAVEPWAIFYEDDRIDNFLSGLFESQTLSPEPRRESSFGNFFFGRTDIAEYHIAPRATTPNHLFPSDSFMNLLPRPKSAS
jgi:hypothetical protein